MDTLVVHPQDPSTDFLCAVYEGMDYKVIRKPMNQSDLKIQVSLAQRVIMLGHGTERGLYDMTTSQKVLIGSEFVYALSGKQNSMFVWCHANKFVTAHSLKGFFTGMIISDYEEAVDWLGPSVNPWAVDMANVHLALALRECIQDPPDVQERKVTAALNLNNPVERFNASNIFSNSKSNW